MRRSSSLVNDFLHSSMDSLKSRLSPSGRLSKRNDLLTPTSPQLRRIPYGDNYIAFCKVQRVANIDVEKSPSRFAAKCLSARRPDCRLSPRINNIIIHCAINFRDGVVEKMR